MRWGRTPRINNNAGRDHWSQAQSVLIAGGGTKPGVIGATDKQAALPTTTPIGIQDLLRTVSLSDGDRQSKDLQHASWPTSLTG